MQSDYLNSLTWCVGLYICIGLMLLLGAWLQPGDFAEKQANIEAEWADYLQKLRTKSWQAPIFILFFPLVWLFLVPMWRPVIFLGIGCAGLVLIAVG